MNESQKPIGSSAEFERERPHHLIQVADETLDFKTYRVADPVPTGRQLLELTGATSGCGYSLFLLLGNGEFKEIRGGGVQKWACFKCPGGCGTKISLSLDPSRRPGWGLSIDRIGRPTISPSVHQQNSCGCHFWVKAGCVDWCHGGEPRRAPR